MRRGKWQRTKDEGQDGRRVRIRYLVNVEISSRYNANRGTIWVQVAREL